MPTPNATGDARAGRGWFLTVEGGEGAGKSTQVRRLAARLREYGLDVEVTREPGGSPRAERIRSILLSGQAKPFGSFVESVLFAAARADHVEVAIEPALSRGRSIICDRFFDSTRVYQGALSGVPDATLRALETAAVGSTRPDLTLTLDVPASLGLARADERRSLRGEHADRFEAEGADYHAAVRQAFLDIAEAEPDRCVVIDASGSPEEVASRIWREVESRLTAWARADGGG